MTLKWPIFFFFILKYALFIFSATNLRKTNLQKHEDENVTIDLDLCFHRFLMHFEYKNISFSFVPIYQLPRK